MEESPTFVELSSPIKRKNSEFQERFAGRMSAVTKDGDVGVAANAKRPIEKLLSTNQSNFSHLH